jgi:SagB-type dehydrogenase family enzyme
MPQPSFAVSQLYHQATKYHPETLAKQGRALDWEQQPDPYKHYFLGQTVLLKPYLSAARSPVVEDVTGDESEAAMRQRQRLSRLLILSYGVTTAVAFSDRVLHLRAAPSAGGLYPAEVYVLSRGIEGLAAGLYNYQVKNHSLVRFWDECDWETLQQGCYQHPVWETTDVAIAVTAVFFRSAWRYEDRAYRRICLDTGHLLGNFELAGNLTGYRVTAIGEFCDDTIEKLLFLDRKTEGPLALLPLQDLERRQAIRRYRWQSQSLASPSVPPIPPTLAVGEWMPYLHEQTRRSALTPTSDRWGWMEIGDRQPPAPSESDGDNGSGNTPSPDPSRPDKYNFPFCEKIDTRSPSISWDRTLQGLANTIRERRSTRQYTGGSIDLSQLLAILDFTYHPEHYRDRGFDPQPDYFDLAAIETFVVANGVNGLDPGCYYYAPVAEELRQVRFKSFRQDMHYLCLGQELGRDAAAAIIHTADLRESIGRFGDRSYRYLHLDAGHLGQRLNLAAVRLGLGASGIAGFFDDRVNEVLGIPVEEAILYLTTLGQPRPQYR